MAAARKTKKQQIILKELEKLAKRLGVRVSYGDLRFGGLRLKGGQCLFKGEKWMVLDRKQAFDDQLDIFLSVLNQADLSGQEIPPELENVLSPLLTADSAESLELFGFRKTVMTEGLSVAMKQENATSFSCKRLITA